jgi:hypothetical protein
MGKTVLTLFEYVKRFFCDLLIEVKLKSRDAAKKANRCVLSCFLVFATNTNQGRHSPAHCI